MIRLWPKEGEKSFFVFLIYAAAYWLAGLIVSFALVGINTIGNVSANHQEVIFGRDSENCCTVQTVGDYFIGTMQADIFMDTVAVTVLFGAAYAYRLAAARNAIRKN